MTSHSVSSSAVLEPTTRRDRKRQRARHELVRSARALIAERGVTDIRVSDVADRADVSQGTFYNHFASKDEIIEAVVSDAVTSLVNAVGDYGEDVDDAAEAMSVGIRQLVELCRVDPELARVLVRLNDAEPLFERLLWDRSRRILGRGLESGRFRSEDPTLSLVLAIGGTLATIRAVIDGRVDGEHAAARCASACLQSVGISRKEAQAITRRPLPDLAPARDGSGG
jgi:AcrR family transcriptional regulator